MKKNVIGWRKIYNLKAGYTLKQTTTSRQIWKQKLQTVKLPDKNGGR